MTLELLKEIIVQNYDIGAIVSIEKTARGSGNTFCISTTDEKYIAKANERFDFVSLYSKIEPVLSGNGFIQSKVVKTVKGELITAEAVVLYAFLYGDTYDRLNPLQAERAIHYLRRYNNVLTAIPFVPSEITEFNGWDKARSLDFLIHHFQYTQYPMAEADIVLIKKAQQILAEKAQLLSEAPKQLIHSDLGPDNFIFKGNNAYSIIDFTPEYENESYSICQFYYWNYLWEGTEYPVEDCLRAYYQRDVANAEQELFYALLIKAALFRIAGALMEGNTELSRRFDILRKTVIMYESAGLHG